MKRMSQVEIWKDIKGYEGEYKISSHGRVYSYPKPRILKCAILKPRYIKGKRYMYVSLFKNKKGKNHYIHRLVALHFIKYNASLCVNHKDGNIHNNNVNNLELLSDKDNQIHAIKNNLICNTPVIRDDGKIFQSMRAASIFMGSKYPSAISDIIYGYKKRYKGHSFKKYTSKTYKYKIFGNLSKYKVV